MHKNLPLKPIFISRRMERRWNRMQAVKMSGAGFAAKEIADFFAVSTRAVYGWLATCVEFGQNGLLAKEGAGRPPKLNEEQMRWISWTVRDSTPNQLRFDFGLWTLRLIGQLIERQFGMTLSLPTLGKIMARLGFTAQRPLHRAYEQDATLVQAWVNTELPALRKRAKDKRAMIMFADEASMRADYHAGTTWVPQGRTPIVKASGQRPSVNMMSAIGLDGQLHFMLVDGRSNAEVWRSQL